MIAEVLNSGTHVHTRYVGTGSPSDELAEAPHQLGPLGAIQRLVSILDDHRLGATIRKFRDRVLQGHRPCESVNLGQRRVLVGIAPQPHPADRGTQPGVVDRDRGPQSDRIVVAEDQLLPTEQLRR